MPQGEPNYPGYNSAPVGDQLVCSQCEREVSQKIADFSKRRYGVTLCMKCQKKIIILVRLLRRDHEGLRHQYF